MSSKKPDLIALSASRIKTLTSCSWLYHCNYILRLPDEGNDGARRGTVTHNVLEFLLKKENREHYDIIMEAKDPFASDVVKKLTIEEAETIGVDDEDNMALIKDFIMVGLHTDFFCEANGLYGEPDLLPPEKKFDLTKEDEEEGKKYKILGFIDKICLYPETKTVRIVDYKTSKQKFSGEEKGIAKRNLRGFNIQALVYSLAAFTLFPEYERVICEFQFLKFPKDPCMLYEYSRKELAGFETYLTHVNEHVCNFSYKHATHNFAVDNSKNFWLCGKFKEELNCFGEPAFICRYKYAFDYYAAEDKNGVNRRCVFEDDEEGIEKLKEYAKENDLTFKKKIYGGCPKFRNKLKGQKR